MNRLRKQILNLLLLVSLVFLCCGRVYGQSPAITAISPSSGPVGMPVTITGTGFGATQVGNTVTLNSTSAIVMTWSTTSITVIVPSGAASGTFEVTVGGVGATSSSFAVTPLPSSWSDSDIGSPGATGSASYANGVFTVSGAGSDLMGGTSDAFHFVYQTLSGDGTIVARVASVSSAYAEVGVMIRETLNSNATSMFVLDYVNAIFGAYRTTTGGSSSYSFTPSAPLPYWVMLVRSGSTFTSYVASDGVNWVQAGTSRTISMASSVYVGLALSSNSMGTADSAAFDNVSLSSSTSLAPAITSLSATTGDVASQVEMDGSNFGSTQGSSLVTLNGSPLIVNFWSASSITVTIPSGATSGYLVVSVAPSMNDSNSVRFTVTANPLPTNWLDQDVGVVGVLGSATFASGTFTVQGAGNGFASTPDAFHFVYQPMSGNGTIIARMATISNAYAMAELTIRETRDPNAKSMAVEAYAGGIYSVYRPTTAGSSSYTNAGVSATAPYWLKLVRSGSSFTAWMASDGDNWVQVGSSQSISMATNVYVGFGVDSGGTSSAYTATFDNVSLGTSTSTAPAISGLSATTGTIGSPVTIAGSGFGSAQGSSGVTLNSAAVTVNSWSATSIAVTIPSGASSGYLVVSVAPSMNDSNAVRFTITSSPLPTGWLDQDVGTVGALGSATFASGTFTIQGAGSSFGSTPDGLHFVYQALSGDGTIIARVTSVSNAYQLSEVMIRETLDQNAKSMTVMDYANIVYSVNRTATAGSATYTTSGVPAAPPYWIKLVRTGNNFTGYTSPDGNNWTIFGGPQPISMQQNVYVGLGVSSGGVGLNTVTFDNVSITSSATSAPVISALSATTGSVGSSLTISGTGFGSSQGSSVVLLNDAAMTVTSWGSSSITVTIPTGATSGDVVVDVAPSLDSSNPVYFTVTSQPLPSGWFDQDIGQVGATGNAAYASGVFTVQGAGNSVTGTVDSFHFVYQPLTADGTIVARVASGSGYGELTVVMIRETLAPSSAEVSAGLFSYTSSFYNYLYCRTLTGGSTVQAGTVGASMPYWLEVVRSANTFSAYVSANGSTWVPVGTTQTLTTAQTVYVGFGVSSGNPATLATATFDNVSVTLGGSLPDPAVSSLTPATGAPGASVTIAGSGFGSTQGTSTVNFNGAAATVASWNDSQIIATVPDSSTTGPVSVTVGNITGQGPTFTIAFGATLTDSLGNQTTYNSSLFGGAWAFTDAQGSGCSSCTTRGTIHRQYDGNGNPAWTTDALGNTISYRHDSSNNMLSQTAQVSTNTVATTTYTYNSFGEPLTAQDPLGLTTTNTYDSHGNLTSVTTPVPASGVAASVTSFAYNSLGELTSITDPLANVTAITYNSVGLMATITDAQSNVTTYAYDSHGNRTSITDALSHQTTFTYDSMERLTKITYPDSTTTQFAYDYRGRRTSVTDQNGKTTSYAYDDADRLTSVTDAASHVTTYAYDTENNLTSIEDANGHTTMFTYDAFGRVTQTSFPSTAAETYGYDAANNLTSKTDRKGQTIQYVYDALNRLSRKFYPDSTEVDYVYDLVGKILQVNDPTGTYAFAYDNMGRLVGTTTSYGFLTGRNFTTGYAYDKASNRTGFTDPESGSTAYVYDTLNRLQTLTPASAFTTGSFGFSYDALSRRTLMTRPNSVSTVYAYDNLSRLTSALHQLSGGTIDGASYTVDNAGNRTAKTDQRAGVTSNYTYDSIYELTGVTQGGTTTETYTFDPVGNRESSLGVSPYNINVSNELTSTPSTTYSYDANGNTTTEVVSSDTTTFAWDYENRLTSVTLSGSGGTVSFKYDPFGRRIYKSSSSGTSVFAYDGDNLVEETTAAGAVVARYSQTQNIDEPLAMLRSGATSYYHADGLGSVTSLSNSAGALAQTYSFDSFGKTTPTGSLVNPFQYTGRELDPETSLYYYRARYYDSSIGRFLNEDPLRFMGDNGSFYEYAYGDPTNFIDPFGMTGQGTGTPVLDPPVTGPSSPPRSFPPPGSNPGTGPGPSLPTGDGFPWGSFVRGIIIELGRELLSPIPTARDEDNLPGPRNPITGRPPCGKDPKDCEAEWKAAREICRELLSRPNPPRRLTGGYKNIEDCARGFVSEACGGNPVDYGKKGKP